MRSWLARRLTAALVFALGCGIPAGPSPAAAQALPFHTSSGLTPGRSENASRSFVTFLGRSGLVRDGTEIVDALNRDIDVFGVVNGVAVGGFTADQSFAVIAPWVRKSMNFTAPNGEPADFDASGVGEMILQFDWTFLRREQVFGTTRLAIQSRAMVPVNQTDATLPSGEVAPRPLQVGDGSWDIEQTLIFKKTKRRLGLIADVGWRVNTGDEGFEAGDVFSYNAAVGFRFVPWVYESLTDQSVVAYLELNGQVAKEDEIGGVEIPNSGGHLLFLSPDLQWIPTPWLLFEGSVQVPVVQDLNGTQLEHETRFQLGTRVRFSIFR